MSFVDQVCIYLIINTVKTVIFWNIIRIKQINSLKISHLN